MWFTLRPVIYIFVFVPLFNLFDYLFLSLLKLSKHAVFSLLNRKLSDVSSKCWSVSFLSTFCVSLYSSAGYSSTRFSNGGLQARGDGDRGSSSCSSTEFSLMVLLLLMLPPSPRLLIPPPLLRGLGLLNDPSPPLPPRLGTPEEEHQEEDKERRKRRVRRRCRTEEEQSSLLLFC